MQARERVRLGVRTGSRSDLTVMALCSRAIRLAPWAWPPLRRQAEAVLVRKGLEVAQRRSCRAESLRRPHVLIVRRVGWLRSRTCP